MSTLLKEAGLKVECANKKQCGRFVSLSTGMSYGGGQTVRPVMHWPLPSLIQLGPR